MAAKPTHMWNIMFQYSMSGQHSRTLAHIKAHPSSTLQCRRWEINKQWAPWI